MSEQMEINDRCEDCKHLKREVIKGETWFTCEEPGCEYERIDEDE